MNAERCLGCGLYTGIFHGYDPICSHCQTEMRYSHYLQNKIQESKARVVSKAKHSRMGMKANKYSAAKYESRMTNGSNNPENWYYASSDCGSDNYEDIMEWEREKVFHEPLVTRKRRLAAEEEAKVLRIKQERMHAAEDRECPECQMIGLCDPTDFLCIVCRDGNRDGIAPGYAHRWRHPKTEAA